jgi:hypothetical protein
VRVSLRRSPRPVPRRTCRARRSRRVCWTIRRRILAASAGLFAPGAARLSRRP